MVLLAILHLVTGSCAQFISICTNVYCVYCTVCAYRSGHAFNEEQVRLLWALALHLSGANTPTAASAAAATLSYQTLLKYFMQLDASRLLEIKRAKERALGTSTCSYSCISSCSCSFSCSHHFRSRCRAPGARTEGSPARGVGVLSDGRRERRQGVGHDDDNDHHEAHNHHDARGHREAGRQGDHEGARSAQLSVRRPGHNPRRPYRRAARAHRTRCMHV